MAVPDWATNLADIYLEGAGNFSALGTGGAGLQIETDYFIQGTNCHSKDAWTNAIKGLITDDGVGSITVPTNGAIVAWLYYSASNALEVQNPGGSPNNGGLMFCEGSSDANYNRYNVGGSDTLAFNSWVPYVVDPNTATPDDIVGAPSGTEQFVGVEANLPSTSGPSKGAPIAIDAIRFGRADIEYIEGSVGDGFNTFSGAEAHGNDLTRRWGLIESVPGTTGNYYVQGFHKFGTSGTLCEFTDANVVLLIRDTPFCSQPFNRFEIRNPSSVVNWDNLIFQGLGAQSPGTFYHQSGSFTATSCQFIDVGAIDLLPDAEMSACTFRNAGVIRAPGSDLTDSVIDGFEDDPDTAAVVWDVAVDPNTNTNGMSFTKGTAATHAIALGPDSPLSMTFTDWFTSGYNASNNQFDSTFYVQRKSGSVTLNIINGTGNFTYQTEGATVTVVVDPVTSTFTILDNNLNPLQFARVLVEASDNTGDLPFEASVTITRSATTATVTHSSHNMSTGDIVVMRGAAEAGYNLATTIVVNNGNEYTYTVDGSLPTPATGAPIATGGVVDGETDSNGEIGLTRTWSGPQPITGVARFSTNSPFFKSGIVTGIISNTAGLATTTVMVLDE